MKSLKITTVLILLAVVITSCSTLRVASDYDQRANLSQYQSYAFFKPGIDKAEISDLDKRRILRAIEQEMAAKGFIKSESEPDLLVSILTNTRENVNIYQNNMYGYYGWGWNPWYWGMGPNTLSTTSEGTLYIDLIDAAGT